MTGASGQDGTYLCERLLAEGTDVHALHHSASGPSVVGHDWAKQVTWHPGDISDVSGLRQLISEVRPDEVYNLAGVSSVAQSWDTPVRTAEVTGTGALSLMDAAWRHQQQSGQPVRFVQASSAEIFGSPKAWPQNEETPIAPVSPYGAAKAYAHLMAGIYRDLGLGVSACILYNHESPRRPMTFVTRKITRGAAAIALGRQGELKLGNLDAARDWGWAPDYVDAMIRAARARHASDFVIATGRARTVREFVAAAFAAAGVDAWQNRVRIDPAFVRPADPTILCGDAKKAREVLGWSPTVGFAEMVRQMVAVDMADLSAGSR